MELVSVIIPCYNVSPFVDKLSWIFEQTYPELEVVLVDDCSTDNTWQKLQEFKKQYADKSLIIAHNEQNLGAGETRNYGLSLSSGKYVCFWDADDEVDPSFISKMIAKLQQEQADFVCCRYETIDADGVRHQVSFKDGLMESHTIDELKLLVFSFDNGPCFKLVDRGFLEEKGIYFPKLFIGEDHCWTVQLVLNASKIAFVNEVLYQYYHDNPRSVMHARDERTVWGFWDMTLFDSECIQKFGQDSVLHARWLIFFFDNFLFLLKDMAVELQKKFILEMRDYCQQHQIDLTGKDFPAYYKFRVYRFLPNIAFFAKKREQMKQAYHLWKILLPFMNKTLALVKEVEPK